ncbi:hypothetical protein SAMN00120144_3095 [Hymenobacter roseosalivarius DSM 11622]|uniref:Outer membrane protein beta-barrel domain-containing protein n=1 Tax=Hymenobacter roseosalivarius DSM 11622 TaxID=645990 RepID=A0A1W1UDT4_9BACT|nr:hypothetical protein [Hymenobacter roseosalivarius]SMB79255.1 hypothetical protein SAMN00120144_3095 [Hymenobacter roseosalivarius DSM 11622]
MKKLLLVALALAGAGTLPALAQRHVKHISSWGVHAGRSEKGDYYELSYTSMLTDQLALRASGLRDAGNLAARGEYSTYQGRLFLAPQLFRIGEIAYVHLLFGAGAGYERTHENRTGELTADANEPQRFTYGPQAGAEVDFFLGNRLSLVATGTKGYLFNNPLIDQWPGNASAGLRYHFR